jgi:hypothetical protein
VRSLIISPKWIHATPWSAVHPFVSNTEPHARFERSQDTRRVSDVLVPDAWQILRLRCCFAPEIELPFRYSRYQVIAPVRTPT